MARPSGRKTSQFTLPSGQPSPEVPGVMNTFIQGLKTEFTGLNFPENACTATENCRFARVGNTVRRNGIDLEANGLLSALDRTNEGLSSFLWDNVGGNGNTFLEVVQTGGFLSFWSGSLATVTNPLSRNFLVTLSFTQFVASGGTFDFSQECQYASGDGYLFVLHPSCDPFYCSFNSGTNTITMAAITIQIRDFSGIPDNLAPNVRPGVLSTEHDYNLQNQGWSSGGSWSGTCQSGTLHFVTGAQTFAITTQSSSSVSNGDTIGINWSNGHVNFYMQGTVTAYTSGVSITINITYVPAGGGSNPPLGPTDPMYMTKLNAGLLNTWFSAEGNYPSNSDIWYTFKDSTGVFNPAATAANILLGVGQAPQGHYVLNAFLQQRSAASGVAGITDITTTIRPRTGAWYAGRVWYSGVDSSQPATGDAPQYTWTENVYFSQIVTDVTNFGYCYQANDPTSETLNALLPDDGGLVQIQGTGSIYKLFPVMNGLIVFAANGIWFITGNTGIGFTANDFSVTKVSGIHCISGTSYVSVDGWPMFWNADGIYWVQPGQSYTSGQRSLEVKNMTLETIKTFYDGIPLSSKKKARGSYNHITGEVQWLFKSTEAVSVTNTYEFDSALVFLTYTGAFYPWTLPSASNIHIHDIVYIEGPGGLNIDVPRFKYIFSVFSNNAYTFSFANEADNVNWVDFNSLSNYNGTNFSSGYTSYFNTGYIIKGQALMRTQNKYIYVYSEQSTTQYTIQGIWNYANSGSSGKYSPVQVIRTNTPLFNKNYRRIRIPGQGYVLQFSISSIPGQPFNISGWSTIDTVKAGV